MGQYDKKIIDKLLDSYESSSLFTGTNKVAVHISFPFHKSTIPAYFDESSLAYEEIHASMLDLERQGIINIVWKKGKEGHIVSKVVLRTEELEKAYAWVSRVPKAEKVAQNRALLSKLRKRCSTPVCQSLIDYLDERLKNAQSVKEFIDLSNVAETELFLTGIAGIEQNDRICYIREFSIEHFHDSKIFESLSGKIARAMRMFGEEYKDKELDEILAEYGIYHTPNYVYFKGDVSLGIGDNAYRTGALRQGLGISGEDIERITFQDVSRICKVITIENLTTFFRWEEPGSLMVYLGGYHNNVRRTLLRKIYHAIPNADYYHFGDIDVGGFLIYEDLRRKTGIPFKRYKMDLEHLMQYEKYGRALTENDRTRIEKILKENPRTEYADILAYMLTKGVKLEQECLTIYLTDRGLKPTGVFVRHGVSSVPATDEAIRQMLKESDGTAFDKTRSINQELTFTYAENVFQKCRLSFDEAHKRTLGLLDIDGYYTNAALLLSDQCGHIIRCAVYEGTGKSRFKTRKEFYGSILKQLDDTFSFLSLNNNLHSTFDGLRRIDHTDYPEEALREALLNAVVHRDYDYSGSIIINIYDDRMEFISLGGLVKGLTLQDIKGGVSQSRNTVIANVFYRLELIESYGTGIQKMLESYENCGFEPEFAPAPASFVVTLPNRNTTKGTVDDPELSREERVLRLFAERGSVSRKDVEQLLGCSSFPANQVLKTLLEQRRIVKTGAARGTRYILK